LKSPPPDLGISWARPGATTQTRATINDEVKMDFMAKLKTSVAVKESREF
jgi:hypothetical protein